MHKRCKLLAERIELDRQTSVVITSYSNLSVDCGLWFVVIKIPFVLEMKYNIVDNVIPVEFLSDSVTGPGNNLIFFFSIGKHQAYKTRF